MERQGQAKRENQVGAILRQRGVGGWGLGVAIYIYIQESNSMTTKPTLTYPPRCLFFFFGALFPVLGLNFGQVAKRGCWLWRT